MVTVALVVVILFLLSGSARTQGHLRFICIFAALAVSVLTVDQTGFPVDPSLYAVLAALFACWILIIWIKKIVAEIGAAERDDLRVRQDLIDMRQQPHD